MATRFYARNTAETTPISPTPDAGWEDVSFLARANTRTTKTSDAMATVSINDSSNADRDVLFRQYVSKALKVGQTITGGQALKAQIRAQEVTASNNLFVAIGIRVIAADGTTVRKTVVAVTRDNTEIADASLQNRQWTATSAATNYTTQLGDRIVIEVGVGGDPSGGNDHDSSLRLGDAAVGDLTEDNTSTTDSNPWIELADTLLFDEIVVPGTATLALAAFAPLIKLHKFAVPGPASLTTSTFAPTVRVGFKPIPGTASLSLTGFAPTVAITNNVRVTPGAASLTTTGFAPTIAITANALVRPGAASLTVRGLRPEIQVMEPGPVVAKLTEHGYTAADGLTEHGQVVIDLVTDAGQRVFEPGADDSVTVVPGAASLSLTTFAPTVLTPRVVVPGAASLTLTGLAPTVKLHKFAVPGAASLSLTTFAPTVLTPGVVIPGTAALSLTTFAPTIVTPVTVVPGTASLTLTGFAPSPILPGTVEPSTATLSLTTFAPTVLTPRTVTPATATLFLTGLAPTVIATSTPEPEPEPAPTPSVGGAGLHLRPSFWVYTGRAQLAAVAALDAEALVVAVSAEARLLTLAHMQARGAAIFEGSIRGVILMDSTQRGQHRIQRELLEAEEEALLGLEVR